MTHSTYSIEVDRYNLDDIDMVKYFILYIGQGQLPAEAMIQILMVKLRSSQDSE